MDVLVTMKTCLKEEKRVMLELLFETDRSMMKFQNVIPDTVLGFLIICYY